MELLSVLLLHSVAHYGWSTEIQGAVYYTTFTSKNLSEKLSLLSKALHAYKPDVSYIEILLDDKEVSTIIKQLKMTCSSGSESKSEDLEYSTREILLVTKAATRIPANCSILIEEGIEEILGHQMEKNDEHSNNIIGSITWQIATSLSGSADMNESERDACSLRSDTGK